MGGGSSRAAGRSYQAAKQSAAKAVSAAAREQAAARAAAPASAPQPAAGGAKADAAPQQAGQPAPPPQQDTLHAAAVSPPSAAARQAAQRPELPPGPDTPQDGDGGRDYVQASMLDQLTGAIRRHDTPQPGSAQAPRQRPRPPVRDTRACFSIADLKAVMQTAQQAALQGAEPDIGALVTRYKLDEATLRGALRHTSLPMVRVDEQGNMVAEAAAPGHWQARVDKSGPAASESSADGAQAAAGGAVSATAAAAAADSPASNRQQTPEQVAGKRGSSDSRVQSHKRDSAG